MKRLSVLSIFAFGILFITCTSTKEVAVAPSARQVDPTNISSYHPPIMMQIAWLPYEDLALKKTLDNNWVVVESENTRKGVIPIIQLVYPESGDTVWVQLNTQNDLLGKLLKHSLMTQEPIFEPYDTYFKATKCSKCHPADIKVDFDR